MARTNKAPLCTTKIIILSACIFLKLSFIVYFFRAGEIDPVVFNISPPQAIPVSAKVSENLSKFKKIHLGKYTAPESLAVVDGEVRKLFPLKDDIKITYLNDFDFLPKGSVILSETSVKYPMHMFFHDFMEGRPNGRLSVVDLMTGEWHQMLDNLNFPSGVQVHTDGKSILIADVTTYRVLKVPLDGGSPSVFIDGLLGSPGNIRSSSRGGYWIPVSHLRDSWVVKFADWCVHYPSFRMALFKAAVDPYLHSLLTETCLIVNKVSHSLEEAVLPGSSSSTSGPLITYSKKTKGATTSKQKKRRQIPPKMVTSDADDFGQDGAEILKDQEGVNTVDNRRLSQTASSAVDDWAAVDLAIFGPRFPEWHRVGSSSSLDSGCSSDSGTKSDSSPSDFVPINRLVINGRIPGIAFLPRDVSVGTLLEALRRDLSQSILARLHLLTDELHITGGDLEVPRMSLPQRVLVRLPACPNLPLSDYKFLSETADDVVARLHYFCLPVGATVEANAGDTGVRALSHPPSPEGISRSDWARGGNVDEEAGGVVSTSSSPLLFRKGDRIDASCLDTSLEKSPEGSAEELSDPEMLIDDVTKMVQTSDWAVCREGRRHLIRMLYFTITFSVVIPLLLVPSSVLHKMMFELINFSLGVFYLIVVFTCLLTYVITSFSDPGYLTVDASRWFRHRRGNFSVSSDLEQQMTAGNDPSGKPDIQETEVGHHQSPVIVNSSTTPPPPGGKLEDFRRVEFETLSFGTAFPPLPSRCPLLQSMVTLYNQCLRQQVIQSSDLADQSNTKSEYVEIDPVVSTLTMPVRYCRRCLLEQPLRCRHCVDCNRCVIKFDHHCPWMVNCIGERNHSVFLVYLALQTGCIWWTVWLAWMSFTPHSTWHVWLSENGLFLTYLISMFATGLCVSLLFAFHLYLALTGLTTWEMVSHNRITYLHHLDGPANPFSQGCLRNCYWFCCSTFPFTWDRVYAKTVGRPAASPSAGEQLPPPHSIPSHRLGELPSLTVSLSSNNRTETVPPVTAVRQPNSPAHRSGTYDDMNKNNDNNNQHDHIDSTHESVQLV